MARSRKPLTVEEKGVYEWQLSVAGFGEAGQKALKASTVLISRIGGVGGAAAVALAAAGIGRLVIAHHGSVKPSDLNRQSLMTAEGLGKSRVESAARRLKDLNPRLAVEAVDENVAESNVERLVASADLVLDAAPLFQERFLLNREAVRRQKPMVDSAMYELEAQLTSFVPGCASPCLACMVPDDPPGWKRQFPVFGAVAHAVGSLAAMEAIKILSGLGTPLVGRLLVMDLRDMSFRTLRLQRDPRCRVCGDRALKRVQRV